jgi:hypothetical protein
MTPELIPQIAVGTRLIANGIWQSMDHALESGIECIAVEPQNHRFRRLNSHHNGEEFNLNVQALGNCRWTFPENWQTYIP